MPQLPRARTIVSRALRLRCPACGGRPIVLSWFRLCSSCPSCGFRLDRGEPGYWVGSYTVNLFATEAVFVAYFVSAMFLTWPSVPWNPVLYGGVAVGVVAPFALFPFTKTLYLAIDLCFRPPEPPDLLTPAERAFRTPTSPAGSGSRSGESTPTG
jgi:uncharacterized protein (DUF983 family)